MASITLTLRSPDTGKPIDHVQSHIPYGKTFEYMEKEMELEKKHEGNQGTKFFIDLKRMQVEFIADLFDDEKITADYILQGLATEDKYIIEEIITKQILNYQKPDDGEKKSVGKSKKK